MASTTIGSILRHVFSLLFGGTLLCVALPCGLGRAADLDLRPGNHGHLSPARGEIATEWPLYTDRYGLIHTVRVADGEPSTGNSLLTTAEACIVMRFNKMSLDKAHKDKIVDALERSQVKPGLFGRGPTKRNDENAHDDYWGLGALDAICGFSGVARRILDYGRGGDQPSGSTVLAIDRAGFASVADKIKQCKTIPYNYNNVHPGVFARPYHSWFGRYPALITHLKGAADEKLSPDELGVWAASLINDTNNMGDDPGRWLVSWIQVITYQMWKYHSSAADFAVTEWWKSLRKTYPGGMKQVMRKYLAVEADTHPLAKYIDDFENFRNPNPTMVDTSSEVARLLGPIESILSHDCEPNDRASCIRYNDFSPANVVTPFTLALSTSSAAVQEASKALADQVYLIEHQAAAVKEAKDVLAAINKHISDLKDQQSQLSRQLSDDLAKKTDMINKGLDKIGLPVHCEPQPPRCPPAPPCVLGVCPPGPPCIPVPPICVPGGTSINPAFQELLDRISRFQQQTDDLLKQINQAAQQQQTAQQDLAYKSSLDALKGVHDRLQGVLSKAKGALDVARGGLQFAQAFVENLIPCGDTFLRH
jgi:hypothetical protein